MRSPTRSRGSTPASSTSTRGRELEEAGATVVDLREAAASAPAIKQVNAVLSRAIELGASDVHFTPQRKRLLVRARVDGVMRELATIPKTLQPAVTSRLKVMAELDIAEKRAPQDGRLSLRTGDRTIDLRVAVLPTTFGEKVTLRIMGSGEAAVTLEELGHERYRRGRRSRPPSAQPFGAVIVVGPTGSGKSTTLHAALSGLNSDERQITTIEDPVEYQVPNADQIEVNPRAGLTFASGLRTILRSDPDVILVGEIRDEETADIAFQAAMTGHMVLSSLHAQNAASAIARLKDMERRPRPDRDCAQLHRRSAARTEAVRELPRVVHAGGGRAQRARHPGVRATAAPTSTAQPAARVARSPATRDASASSR